MFFCFLATTASTVSAGKVEVRIFIEAGCPYCVKYLAGPLQQALADKDVSTMMEVDISPFGNAFFVTDQCGITTRNGTTAGKYDVGSRDCFNKKCGSGVASRPVECFSGDVVCQHGAKECAFNRYMACAKHVSPKSNSSSPAYLPFITCMEHHYPSTKTEIPSDTLVSSCSQRSGISRENLQACYDGSVGTDAIIEEASATPEHAGVPWILVNGRPVPENYEMDALVKAVRDARGKRPGSVEGSSSFLAVSSTAAAQISSQKLQC